MIDLIDKKLNEWVGTVVQGVQPSFSPPTDADDTLAISLYLLELVDDPRRHNTGRPKLQPSLRYLVTTRAGEPQDAHRLLGVLFYAALDHPEYEVELEPVDTQLWSAFGIAPRPAFILRLPLPHEWKLPELPLVSQGVSTGMRELVTLYGRVLGPGDTPLARARVELPNLNRSAHTGPNGRFTLTGVPAAPAAKSLLIAARGREQLFTVKETGSEAAPEIFRFDISVTLYGRVVRPGDAPLAQAQVELPALRLSTATDAQGRFILASVPAAPAAKQIVIRSGGLTQSVTVRETGGAEAPVVFIFKPVS